VYGDPRGTKPSIQETPGQELPQEVQGLAARLRRQREEREAEDQAPAAQEAPEAAQVAQKAPESRPAERPSVDREALKRRLLEQARESAPRVSRAEERMKAPVMPASPRSNGKPPGRLSRLSLPDITSRKNDNPVFVQTNQGLLSDRKTLGDQFPKFMLCVTVLGLILSVGSTINAVVWVIHELTARGVLTIMAQVSATTGLPELSSWGRLFAIFVGSIVASGISWGQAQLSDQITNNQALGFWTLEGLDMSMTFAWIRPVVDGGLTIIREHSVQAFYTLAGAEIAIVAAFCINQVVRARRMDEELDRSWFLALLAILFIVGNIISRAALSPLDVVQQVAAATFGICAFVSFLSAYMPELTAFGSRLRRVGRKDTGREPA
jgi:hypothetical protein